MDFNYEEFEIPYEQTTIKGFFISHKGDHAARPLCIFNNGSDGSIIDILTYGGAGFASALIKAGLVDDYHLFINPTAIGDGMPIFKMLDSKLGLKLVNAHAFEVGIVALNYIPA